MSEVIDLDAERAIQNPDIAALIHELNLRTNLGEGFIKEALRLTYKQGFKDALEKTIG